MFLLLRASYPHGFAIITLRQFYPGEIFWLIKAFLRGKLNKGYNITNTKEAKRYEE